jgi:membrane-associated phospholipid phosphatase
MALLFITIRWKISAHAAAIGGLLGGFLTLAFRLQENPVLILSAIILAAGLVSSARLILGKHTVPQVIAGFFLGLIIMVMAFSFV